MNEPSESILVTLQKNGLTKSVRGGERENRNITGEGFAEGCHPIKGLGKTARANMQELFLRINWPEYTAPGKGDARYSRGFMATLNCNRLCRPDHETVRKQIRNLKLAMRRAFPVCSGLWKLELASTDGTPHLHVVLLFPEPQSREDLTKWFLTTWHRIAELNSKESRNRAVCIQSLYGNPAVKLCSYLGKRGYEEHQDWPPGAAWGRFNVKALPLLPPIAKFFLNDAASKLAFEMTCCADPEMSRRAQTHALSGAGSHRGITHRGLREGYEDDFKNAFLRNLLTVYVERMQWVFDWIVNDVSYLLPSKG
nr:hypothetical protein [uncultured Desulfuromonas sp.]